MTTKRSQPIDPEDLSARARRGTLGADEQAALESALEASATLRAAHLVGRDFDDARRVLAGDDELVQRACAKVLEPPGGGRVARRGLMKIPAVAVLLLASAAAATSTWLVVREASVGRWPQAAARASATSTRNPSDARAPARALDSDTVPPPELLPNGAPSESARRAEAPRPTTLAPSSSAGPTAPAEVRSAATLFRDANAARRAGDLGTAKALYAELQASFGHAREARVSHVSLGKLLLASGMSRDAERQFRLYLTTGGGDLAEEAMVGRAEALARLGQTEEERGIWQELVRSRPSSVYAERARKRIEQLAATSR